MNNENVVNKVPVGKEHKHTEGQCGCRNHDGLSAMRAAGNVDPIATSITALNNSTLSFHTNPKPASSSSGVALSGPYAPVPGNIGY